MGWPPVNVIYVWIWSFRDGVKIATKSKQIYVNILPAELWSSEAASVIPSVLPADWELCINTTLFSSILDSCFSKIGYL